MSTPKQLEQAAITVNRFRKAQRIADLLEGEGVTHQQASGMIEGEWLLVIRAARMREASIVTRSLAVELLRDRWERKNRG
jgi:hypothetical protein